MLFFIEGKLKEVLPVLLHFHGVIKAVDVFMNLDFKLSLETLVDFRGIHEPLTISQENQLAVIQKVFWMVQRHEKKENPSSHLVDPNPNLDSDVSVEVPAVSELRIPCDMQENLIFRRREMKTTEKLQKGPP